MESRQNSIVVIIPARNEESAIGRVLDDIPGDLVEEIIVADNGCTDQTATIARDKGATVVKQPIPGYGNACLKALQYLSARPASPTPDIVVFMDGDYSDYPQEMYQLVHPIIREGFDLVIGSRTLGKRQPGALQPQQIFGNWLATRLIQWLWGHRFTDLGPFRAIRYQALCQLNMQDKNYGWTVEMQIKAVRHGLKCKEIPVSYRKRIGFSKVSGNLKGSILAGYKILWIIAREFFTERKKALHSAFF